MKMRSLIPLLFLLLMAVSCHKPEPRPPIVKKSGQFLKKSALRNKAIQEAQEKRIHEIIESDSSHKYLVSPNGFWYRYDKKNEAGDTLTPQFGDVVLFNYDISSLNGKPIYSKEEIGAREYKVDQEDIFTGMRNGLKLMKVGETVTFYFPSSIAFDYYGDEDKIGQNVPIRSTVTLNSIKESKNKKK